MAPHQTLKQWCARVGVSYMQAWRAFRRGTLTYPDGHALAGQPVPAFQSEHNNRIYVREDDRAALAELADRLEAAGYRFAERPDDSPCSNPGSNIKQNKPGSHGW